LLAETQGSCKHAVPRQTLLTTFAQCVCLLPDSRSGALGPASHPDSYLAVQRRRPINKRRNDSQPSISGSTCGRQAARRRWRGCWRRLRRPRASRPRWRSRSWRAAALPRTRACLARCARPRRPRAARPRRSWRSSRCTMPVRACLMIPAVVRTRVCVCLRVGVGHGVVWKGMVP